MIDTIPEDWRGVLKDELEADYFGELQSFVAEERAGNEVFPSEEDVFSALRYTPYENVKVLLLGQDPYHDVGQAHGLCFSVQEGVRFPPSLRNIFKELKEDLGYETPDSGYLASWAREGVLMINTVLTVRAHEANSHKGQGWETFTDAIIRKVNEKENKVVFVLWGAHAQKKTELIDQDRHTILATAHPSPLSARRGFFGSRPFSRINEELSNSGQAVIDWSLESSQPVQPELF